MGKFGKRRRRNLGVATAVPIEEGVVCPLVSCREEFGCALELDDEKLTHDHLRIVSTFFNQSKTIDSAADISDEEVLALIDHGLPLDFEIGGSNGSSMTSFKSHYTPPVTIRDVLLLPQRVELFKKIVERGIITDGFEVTEKEVELDEPQPIKLTDYPVNSDVVACISNPSLTPSAVPILLESGIDVNTPLSPSGSNLIGKVAVGGSMSMRHVVTSEIENEEDQAIWRVIKNSNVSHQVRHHFDLKQSRIVQMLMEAGANPAAVAVNESCNYSTKLVLSYSSCLLKADRSQTVIPIERFRFAMLDHALEGNILTVAQLLQQHEEDQLLCNFAPHLPEKFLETIDGGIINKHLSALHHLVHHIGDSHPTPDKLVRQLLTLVILSYRKCDGQLLVNYADQFGRTPLYLAVATNCPHLVLLLLGIEGIDVNKASPIDGRTPLHRAYQLGKDGEAVVELLLANGADAEIRSGAGDLPGDEEWVGLGFTQKPKSMDSATKKDVKVAVEQLSMFKGESADMTPLEMFDKLMSELKFDMEAAEQLDQDRPSHRTCVMC